MGALVRLLQEAEPLRPARQRSLLSDMFAELEAIRSRVAPAAVLGEQSRPAG